MLSLELVDELDLNEDQKRTWEVRRDGDLLGKCDDRDDPTNPIFWEIPGFDPEDHSCSQRQQNLADFFMFSQRL